MIKDAFDPIEERRRYEEETERETEPAEGLFPVLSQPKKRTIMS